MDNFIIALFIITCLLLIVVVLLQKGRGGGLGAAFSGLGSSAFGTRVGDVFTWVTIVLTAAFLILGIVASLWFHKEAGTVATPTVDTEPARPWPQGTTRVKVLLNCETKTSKIYYTTDGTDPVEPGKGTLYKVSGIEVPLTDTPVEIKARAFRRGWKKSEPASESLRLPLPVTDPVKPPAETQPATAPTTAKAA